MELIQEPSRADANHDMECHGKMASMHRRSPCRGDGPAGPSPHDSEFGPEVGLNFGSTFGPAFRSRRIHRDQPDRERCETDVAGIAETFPAFRDGFARFACGGRPTDLIR